MSKITSLKQIGYCKDCTFWPEDFITTSDDLVDCKKDIYTSVKGKWGCRFWNPNKEFKKILKGYTKK